MDITKKKIIGISIRKEDNKISVGVKSISKLKSQYRRCV